MYSLIRWLEKNKSEQIVEEILENEANDLQYTDNDVSKYLSNIY